LAKSKNIEERRRYLGIDIGAETVKVVELTREGDGPLVWTRRALAEHFKDPVGTLDRLVADMDPDAAAGAAITGRMSRSVRLTRIPSKQAQIAAYQLLFDEGPATVVSIGSHGFSVLELRSSHAEVFRENTRCSQGTGNFLRQLVERFDMSIEAASALCEGVGEPAPLSGRCPVILKTDMTHLANKGESAARILAGLFDAVCENVEVLIKPRVSPKRLTLIGGVARSARIRDHFARFAAKHGMELAPPAGDDGLYFEAVGAGVIAAESTVLMPRFADWFGPPEAHDLDILPPLSDYLNRVRRLEAGPRKDGAGPVVLGFDIGSTGSKIVALDAASRESVWESYLNTNGAPVKAAQALMERFTQSEAAARPVLAVGATGSGREIVGSLMTTCYGPGSVFVLNEIAAHAEGALHHDPRVDTIFEIGGQDAKYIRLAGGRVVDAAMNEACSAGTGSFIEEQGKKFAGIRDVVQLADEALAAGHGVFLGQHCSVFMAEIIDEAVASHVPQRSIIAGIYDSIIQNYLNRVKGSRSVGEVVFCQGMPFSSNALAAAVVRQTGAEVVVPPNPGTVGALGIALLAIKEIDFAAAAPIEPRRFLDAEVVKKDVFVCRSTQGCGGSGNRCRIDRITTVVDGKEQRFTWGGGCSMYDKGTRKRKLPDLTPNPFREREELIEAIRTSLSAPRGRKTIAITDEFALKTLFPYFATFFHEAGFDPVFFHGADQTMLKRGIEDANVPFCAPMQQYHGLVSTMAEAGTDYLFLPMLRGIQRIKKEPWARLCPIVQGSADILKWDLGQIRAEIVSPVINIGKDNLRSKLFVDSITALAAELGLADDVWRAAHEKAARAQEEFDATCVTLGERALDFAAKHDLTPVVVLGRTYTIYNTVLNSNVPALLREQGALPIPVDCYPVADDVPLFPGVYWGYGLRNLRAAHQIRRTPGVYSLFASNYSCGPDSFSIHFFGYVMEGKPFAIIETDGHSGDAGTKTRIEAYLYCVHEDRKRGEAERAPGKDLFTLQTGSDSVKEIQRRDATVLIPRMGPGAEALAAVLRGLGIRAEALPMPDQEALELGRRHTSGKECFPMVITLGSLIKRVLCEADTSRKFSFFMPTANGPCRFGSYATLDRIVIERLGWNDRVTLWAPIDEDYFESVPDGAAALVYAALTAADVLLAGLYYARPVERQTGAAEAVWRYYMDALVALVERRAKGNLSAGAVIAEVLGGRIFDVVDLLRRASRAFMDAMDNRDMPEVLVVGEIYVRCDAYSNNFVIDKLEARGIRCRFAAFNEWIEYTDYQDTIKTKIPEYVKAFLQASIQHQLYAAGALVLRWPRRTTVQDSLHAAKSYIREQLSGEAVLTLGGSLHEWREGHVDGVVCVGPLECMPNKISEAHFFHAAEREGLHSLTLYLNGDPVDPEILDNFAFEMHAQFRRRCAGHSLPPPPLRPRQPIWRPQSRVNPRDA
jgi:activator of 2-hydroxyglutaryl-CoA dehydratase/predicted nucleotide-binding protein (sugar kinase/HSP70/actin superfamily)